MLLEITLNVYLVHHCKIAVNAQMQQFVLNVLPIIT